MIRLLRYLRIAASAVALATCVWLAIQWTHGPWVRRCLEWMSPTPQYLSVGSTGSALGFSVEPRYFSGAEFISLEPYPYYHEEPLPTKLGFLFWKDEYSCGFFAPFWALIPLSLLLSASPWIRWTYSIRTLLITMTLIAVVLGLIRTLP